MDNVIERLLKQKNERISDLENENKALGIINDEIGKLNKNLIEENKNLKEKLSEITMVSDDEKQSIEHVLELEKENKNLKLTLEQMENTCKDYLNDRDTLREENKKLNERIRFLEECLDNKEKVNKQLREELGKFVMNNPS